MPQLKMPFLRAFYAAKVTAKQWKKRAHLFMNKLDAKLARLKQTMIVISVHFLQTRAILRPTISTCASVFKFYTFDFVNAAANSK